MTGRLPAHVDMTGAAFTNVIAPSDPERAYPGIPRSMSSLAEKLVIAGYTNHYVGKWDVGVGSPRQTPLQRGFESFLDTLATASIITLTRQSVSATALVIP